MASEIHNNHEPLPLYRARARNTAAESENRIHDDEVAAKYGFRGGLVPGVTVYGYMTVPVVEKFGPDWLERGSMQVKFHRPIYDGDEVIVRGRISAESFPMSIEVIAERSDGTTCASALATMRNQTERPDKALIDEYPLAPLPPVEARPIASRERFVPGSPLGTIQERLNLRDDSLLRAMEERLSIYYGESAVAHPAVLLALSNQILSRNFKLGPWIHAESAVINRSIVRDEEIAVRGRIVECFERKGHEFVVIDVLVLTHDNRVAQQVRHTAIYRPRFAQG
ncbi:MAG TPA: MaoC family dehydratase [Blastocatellia bacterium]|nr:MaoC family dehydratase [Blastocatellia bacterium]